MPEWFRNHDWNDDIEKMFFERLARARSQRDQYLVIQALLLSQSHPKVTLRLIEHYFETRKEDFHDERASRAVAAAHFALGGYDEALDTYLKTITEPEDAERDLFVGSPLEFGFLAARFRSARHYDAALDHLARFAPPEGDTLDARFRYFAANALILSETGRDPARAVREAGIAMEVPEVVAARYPDVVWRLRGILRR